MRQIPTHHLQQQQQLLLLLPPQHRSPPQFLPRSLLPFSPITAATLPVAAYRSHTASHSISCFTSTHHIRRSSTCYSFQYRCFTKSNCTSALNCRRVLEAQATPILIFGTSPPSSERFLHHGRRWDHIQHLQLHPSVALRFSHGPCISDFK